MLPDIGYVERHMSEELRLRLFVHSASRPLDIGQLTEGERERLGAIRLEHRRRDWLVGRSALKRLLRRMGEATDTARLRFPHPRISLTHNHGVAVAVGCTKGNLRGLGVDLQMGRLPKHETLRFYLSAPEQSWILQRGRLSGEDALRLWTVKEAVLKCDPHNQGRILFDYAIPSPEDWVGQATCRGEGSFEYTSMAVESGFLTVAVSKESFS